MSTIEIRGSLALGPYEGYHGHAEYDPEEGEFHGRVIDTRDVITFVGSDIVDLKTAFQESVDDYLDFCKSRGEDPEKPYSGNYPLRMSPALHRSLAIVAFRASKSFNQCIVEILQDAVDSAVAVLGKAETGAKPTVKITTNWEQNESLANAELVTELQNFVVQRRRV